METPEDNSWEFVDRVKKRGGSPEKELKTSTEDLEMLSLIERVSVVTAALVHTVLQ